MYIESIIINTDSKALSRSASALIIGDTERREFRHLAQVVKTRESVECLVEAPELDWTTVGPPLTVDYLRERLYTLEERTDEDRLDLH